MKRATLGFLVLALSALMSMLVAFASPAAAHTDMLSTDPADGATLAEVPRTITLVFNEDLLPETVKVSVADGAGMVVRVADPTVKGGTVKVLTPPGLTPPAFTVNYRVVSQDGHPVTGSFSFTAGSVPEAVASASPAVPSPAASAPTSLASASIAPSSIAPTTPAASAAASPADAPSDAPSTATGISPWLFVLIGLVIVIVVAVLMVLLARRRTPSA